MIRGLFSRRAPEMHPAVPPAEAEDATGGPDLAVFPGAGFGPAQWFDDIPILPAQFIDRTMYGGGPLWPDFNRQIGPRHCRHGRPIDAAPPAPGSDPPLPQITEPVCWGGQVYHHFGHQIADYAGRVIQTCLERPADPVLFLLRPGGTPDKIPGHFHQIMDWLGLPRDRIRFINAPHLARRLYVAPQAEQLPDIGPAPAYLRALEANWQRQGLAAMTSRVLYVARASMLRTGAGGHAGESYLIQQLKAAGVRILVPEQVPLRHQIRAYAGAEHLIFSEGSAMHGRQLLGHVPQTITVLNRRPQMRTALQHLRPRCDRLAYLEASRHLLCMVRPDGQPRPVDGVSLLDPVALTESLARLGLDLRPDWDAAAFAAARDADILAWLRVKASETAVFDMAKSRNHLRQQFDRSGVAHLTADLDQILGSVVDRA